MLASGCPSAKDAELLDMLPCCWHCKRQKVEEGLGGHNTAGTCNMCIQVYTNTVPTFKALQSCKSSSTQCGFSDMPCTLSGTLPTEEADEWVSKPAATCTQVAALDSHDVQEQIILW